MFHTSLLSLPQRKEIKLKKKKPNSNLSGYYFNHRRAAINPDDIFMLLHKLRPIYPRLHQFDGAR